ncbi:MAG: hypothetical protein ABEN55_00645 [Bradymonadaceae bacterium]
MSETLEYIPNYPEIAVDSLPTAFRQADDARALVASLAEGAQMLEDELFDLIVSSFLSTARGDQLDQWGELCGEPRQDLEDEDYRVFIHGRMMVNRSDGTPDELIEIYQRLTAPSVVKLWELYPKAFHLTAFRRNYMRKQIRTRIRRTITDAKPAGTDIVLSESPWDALDDEGGTLQPGGFARLL